MRKNIFIFPLKINFFPAAKNRCILYGCVFVMKFNEIVSVEPIHVEKISYYPATKTQKPLCVSALMLFTIINRKKAFSWRVLKK